MTNLYPLAGEVCGYTSYEHFSKQRYQTGQWVFWEDRLDHILMGEYSKVFPLHVEFAITYRCNYLCPWCSCRAVRSNFYQKNLRQNNQYNNDSTSNMGWINISNILNHLAEKKVGIQWTGGEPLLHPLFIQAVKKANQLGIKQCIFSNGSLLTNSKIHSLLESKPIFIRISLNAITPEIHARFHGLKNSKYSKKVLENIESLVTIKASNNLKTLIGLSFVFDSYNLNELDEIALYLKYLCDKYGPRAINYCIIRPAYAFQSSIVNLEDSIRKNLLNKLSPSVLMKKVGDKCGIDFIAPHSSFLPQSEYFEETNNLKCHSYGLFGEITPTGDMIICSDKYGENDNSIGNIANNSLSTIWKSEKRELIIEKVIKVNCFQNNCPRNGRGFLYNKLFHDIERYRKKGDLLQVDKWVKDLKGYLPIPEHSFFL